MVGFLAGCGKGPVNKSHLIDRELFFGNPALASPQVSPDGRWVAFLKERNGILNIHLVAWGESLEKARSLTNEKERPPAGFTWTLNWQRRVVCTPISTAGVTSFWDFGDGKTSTANVGVNTYAVNGTYTVRLIQTNITTGCKDTADIPVAADHTGVKTIEMQALSIYPNPLSAGESFRFSGALATAPVQALYITDMTGRVVYAGGSQQGTDLRIPASLLPGLYQIQARSGGSWFSARIQVQ